MANVIIVAILAVILVIAVRETRKHLKGEGSCCGGGSAPVKLSEKKLDGEKLGEYTLDITGMHCENCAIRVTNALNRIEGASAKVNYKKGKAVVSYDRTLEEKDLRRAVESQGYHVTAVGV